MNTASMPFQNGARHGRPAEILLVEDSPGDVRLTMEAFAEGPVPVNLSVARDGVEALAFLRRQGQYGEAPRPALVLLDLNLPRKDGREVLAEMKADPLLKTIPVVVFSTSRAEDDVASCYALHANCYVAKPVDLDEFLRVVHNIEEFWLQQVTLPLRS